MNIEKGLILSNSIVSLLNFLIWIITLWLYKCILYFFEIHTEVIRNKSLFSNGSEKYIFIYPETLVKQM